LKRLVELWKTVANELANLSNTCATRDGQTVTSRTEHEGLSFLGITLPSFGKAFERGLELGKYDSSSFTALKHRKGECLPAFLQGFTSQVFDPVSGVLLSEPSVDCIYAVRQLTLMFGKILVECSEKRTRDAMQRFVELEEELHDRAGKDIPDLQDFRRITRLLFSDVFAHIENELFSEQLRPKHGPGATADRLTGNRKYGQVEWPVRLEALFPSGEFLIPNIRHYSRIDHVKFL